MGSKQVAVITGGTGALGTAVVSQLLERGFDCHVTWQQDQELSRFTLRDQVTLHRVDCTSEQEVHGFFHGLPRVDASVHTVGGFAMAPLTTTSLADLEHLLRLNTVTAFLCTREAVALMARVGNPGRIVNVIARPVLSPAGGMVAYAMSKAAVASLTQCAAEEVRSAGILINAIAPSIMDTPANRTAMPTADFTHWPKLHEVAHTITFLATAENTLTTGTLIPVYGRT